VVGREGKESVMKMVAVIQLSLEPEWFHLDSRKRILFRGQLAQILNSNPNLNCRWFDSEPWTGSIAEFFVCEFSSLHEYWKFWNEFREHPIFREPFAKIKRLSLGVERSLLEDKVVGL
jgi:hypothetical protein